MPGAIALCEADARELRSLRGAPDDPADHRGILSWFAQPHDRKLNEAGSYGYLVEAAIPEEIIAKAKGKLTIRLETDDHGLAIYGSKFGRFPLDLTLLF